MNARLTDLIANKSEEILILSNQNVLLKYKCNCKCCCEEFNQCKCTCACVCHEKKTDSYFKTIASLELDNQELKKQILDLKNKKKTFQFKAPPMPSNPFSPIRRSPLPPSYPPPPPPIQLPILQIPPPPPPIHPESP